MEIILNRKLQWGERPVLSRAVNGFKDNQSFDPGGFIVKKPIFNNRVLHLTKDGKKIVTLKKQKNEKNK